MTIIIPFVLSYLIFTHQICELNLLCSILINLFLTLEHKKYCAIFDSKILFTIFIQDFDVWVYVSSSWAAAVRHT